MNRFRPLITVYDEFVLRLCAGEKVPDAIAGEAMWTSIAYLERLGLVVDGRLTNKGHEVLKELSDGPR